MRNLTVMIRHCPTCGSARIRRVRKGITDTYKGQKYTVPSVSFHECPDCGERLFDRVAMRHIETRSPAFRKVKAAT